MPMQMTDLFLPEDLQDAGRTSGLSPADREATLAVSAWIDRFVIRPHQDLGRTGPVCPFVPRSLERKVLWLAAEHVGDGGVARVVEVLGRYKTQLLRTEHTDGDDADFEVIVVVFPDLPADRARGVFDGALAELAAPSYAEEGIVFGPFYDGHSGTAIYNPGFRPFQSPVPFVFVRRGVVGDWKFFLDDPVMFGHWAHRFGEAAVHALADEVRRLPWRGRRY